MRYHHLEGVTQKESKSKRWMVSIPFIMLIVGAYITVNMNAPLLQGIDGRSPEDTAKKLLSIKPGDNGNRLYIPQINVDIPIENIDDVSALAGGAWHRDQQSGNPETGGAFVLGARKLTVGMTPAETKVKSPFYHLDKLQVGDELFVDWQGKRHVYEVKKRVMVDSVDSLFQKLPENDEPALGLYVANEQGELESDVAIKAQRVGVVAWGNKPVIQRDDQSAN